MGDTHGHTTSPSRHTRRFFPWCSIMITNTTQNIPHSIFSQEGDVFAMYKTHITRVTPNISGDKRIHIFGYFFSFPFRTFFLLHLCWYFFSFLSIVVVSTGVLRFLLLYIQTTTTMPRVVFDRHVDVYILNVYIFREGYGVYHESVLLGKSVMRIA